MDYKIGDTRSGRGFTSRLTNDGWLIEETNNQKANKKIVFIGHDFTGRGGRVRRFRDAVEDVLTKHSYDPSYAGKQNTHTGVLKDITRKIKNAEFCIFDLTGYKKKGALDKNLNVILELGISIGCKEQQSFITHKKGAMNILEEMSDIQGTYFHAYKNYSDLGAALKEFIISLKKI